MAGTPSHLLFAFHHGSDSNQAHQSVRIPIPVGKEAEAHAVVEAYHAAS